MLGYLKRGQTYRRRGEFVAAIRDLRRASEIDPAGHRVRSRSSGTPTSPTRRTATAPRPSATEDYVKLDNRAAARALQAGVSRATTKGTPPQAIDALQRAIAIDDRFAEAHYLLGLCHRDAQQPEAARARARTGDRSCSPRCCTRARSWPISTARWDGPTSASTQLERAGAPSIPVRRARSRSASPTRAPARPNAPSRRSGAPPSGIPSIRTPYVALGRVWLEIAQARGDRVALSKALEALEGRRRQRRQQRGADALRPRAAASTSDEETAERMLQDATQKQPVDPLAFYYLADAAERLRPLRRRPPGAARLRGAARRRGRRAPPQRATPSRLGDLSLKLNEPAAAATYFLRAADGADAALLARAADAQLRAGDNDAARATAAKALEKDPNNALARDASQSPRRTPPKPQSLERRSLKSCSWDRCGRAGRRRAS